jgi:hypothetical protein
VDLETYKESTKAVNDGWTVMTWPETYALFGRLHKEFPDHIPEPDTFVGPGPDRRVEIESAVGNVVIRLWSRDTTAYRHVCYDYCNCRVYAPPLSGYEFFQWPEWQALRTRLGVVQYVYDKDHKVRFGEGEEPTITQTYTVREPKTPQSKERDVQFRCYGLPTPSDLPEHPPVEWKLEDKPVLLNLTNFFPTRQHEGDVQAKIFSGQDDQPVYVSGERGRGSE